MFKTHLRSSAGTYLAKFRVPLVCSFKSVVIGGYHQQSCIKNI